MKKLAIFISSLSFITISYSQTTDNTIKLSSYKQFDSIIKLSKQPIDFNLVETELIRLINEYRTQNNLSPVSIDLKLKQAVEFQAKYICSTKVLTHKNPNLGFETFKDRINQFNNNSYMFNQSGGECIARNSIVPCYAKNIPLANDILNLFKSSPSHNKIITDPNVTRINTSIQRINSDDQIYTCLILL